MLTWRDVDAGVCDCRCHGEVRVYNGKRLTGGLFEDICVPWDFTPVPLTDPTATACACVLCSTRHAIAVNLIVAESRTHRVRMQMQSGYRAHELFMAWVRGKRADYQSRRKESHG